MLNKLQILHPDQGLCNEDESEGFAWLVGINPRWDNRLPQTNAYSLQWIYSEWWFSILYDIARWKKTWSVLYKKWDVPVSAKSVNSCWHQLERETFDPG